MRSQQVHIKQAEENELLGERLLRSNDPASIVWAVTLFYYTAAHYGRAYLVSKNTSTITSHSGFESYFRRAWPKPPTLDVFPLYQSLKYNSERARYDCVNYTEQEVRQLRDDKFNPLRAAIRLLLGLP
jgi:uncharacterized protein (UPF0332 family)